MGHWHLAANEITVIPRNINQNADAWEGNSNYRGERTQPAKPQESALAQLHCFVRR
jgi:hypothetical protein